MDNDTLKLTSVLADSTRFAIYKDIVQLHKNVNVQEIAEKFQIHPNVARLHLTKLEDVNLLTSITEKNGRGGRPNRIYSLSKEDICLQFPTRNYQLLANIAIDSLRTFGEEGMKIFDKMGKAYGKEVAIKAMIRDGIDNLDEVPLNQKIESIKEILQSQGIPPKIEIIDENTISFSLYSCIFHKTDDNEKNKMICQMHYSIFIGIFETYLGEIDFMREENKECTSTCCQFFIILLPIK
ncbi:MAG: helix-turn-helix transcriptional regulator [Vulcanibacillus sp.]